MVAFRLSNPADLLERCLVADVPAERVARIRGIDDDAVVANDLNGALQQAPLRVDGMHFEVLAHSCILRFGYRSVSGGVKMARSPPESGAAPRTLRQSCRHFSTSYRPSFSSSPTVFSAFTRLPRQSWRPWRCSSPIQWFRHRKVPKMFLATAVVVWVFGAITLILRNPVFIQWKPSIVSWFFALAFFGSHVVGQKKTLIERAMADSLPVEPALCRQLSAMWIVVFILLGAINLYVVYHFSEEIWVDFKVFGITGITLRCGTRSRSLGSTSSWRRAIRSRSSDVVRHHCA